MAKTDKEILDNYKARVKAQNEAAKENWDTVSCRLPKGTKDRIKALGLTVNGVINDCVLKFLNTAENAQNANTIAENTKADKSIDEVSNVAMLAELQAELDARKVKHPDEMTAEEREQVRQENIVKSECPF